MGPYRVLVPVLVTLSLGVLLAAQASSVVSAQEAPLRLATRYVAQRVDSPNPAQSGELGWLGIANAGDIDRDGKDDLLVPQYNGPGQIFVISGATGATIRTLNLPDPSTGGSAGNFVYPAKLADVASCPGGQAGQLCGANPIPAGDGVPEVLVGATGVDFGPARDVGRAYVFDGATGALLKRVDMPPADLASEIARAPKSFSFGRAVVSPASPHAAEAAVRIGDMDGGGKADLVVGNPTFYEEGPATNPACSPGPCIGSGRVYFYRGEDIAGSNPSAILDAAFEVVRNPIPQSDHSGDANHERFGHALIPVGDIGECRTDPGAGALCRGDDNSNTPDRLPDVVVAAHETDFPAGFTGSGVVHLLDGSNAALLRTHEHPEPQTASIFGYAVGTMSTAIGDVGSTALPDIFVPAVVQRVRSAGEGRAYLINGNPRATGGSVTLSLLDDPTPNKAGNFGAPWAGVGNVAGDPRNEVLVGSAGPWQPGDNLGFLGDVHVIDPVTERALLSVEDPDKQPGSGFGQGVAALGDLNGDRLLDFAVASGFFDGSTGVNQGRLYIFRSARDVRRGLSLSLRGHLVAAGALSAPSQDAACVARAPITITRNGRAVKRSRTNATGAYSFRLPDRPGRYQAVADRLEVNGLTCERATSRSLLHRHNGS